MTEGSPARKFSPKHVEGRAADIVVGKGRLLNPLQKYRTVASAPVAVERGGKTREVPNGLVWKSFKKEGEGVRAQRTYERLKALGLPVLPTHRLDEEANITFMTNLNTSERIALSDNNESLALHKERFIESLEGVEEVAETMFRGAGIAASNHISLSTDPYFFIVDREPNDRGVQKIDVVVGDYETIDMHVDADRISINETNMWNLQMARFALEGFIRKYAASEEVFLEAKKGIARVAEQYFTYPNESKDSLQQWRRLQELKKSLKGKDKGAFNLPKEIYVSGDENDPFTVKPSDISKGELFKVIEAKDLAQEASRMKRGQWKKIREAILRDVDVATRNGIKIVGGKDGLLTWRIVRKPFSKSYEVFVGKLGTHTSTMLDPLVDRDPRNNDLEFLREKAVASLDAIEEELERAWAAGK